MNKVQKISILEKNDNSIGLKTRRQTQGKELELVKKFIEYYANKFESKRTNTKLAIFCEPYIESGFPDIVFAEYIEEVYSNWNEKREKLKTNDLKVLQHIITNKKITSKKIKSQLGLTGDNDLLPILEKLYDANLITRKNGLYEPKNIDDIYGIKKLEAFEAKINNITTVVEQANINSWFASKTFILSNVNHPTEKTIQKLEKTGVGMYTLDKDFIKLKDAKKHNLPNCYISLLFNEWVGKKVNM